ncbi:MAG TPA: hypothetical protein PK534_01795 [Chitinophagales bacterium]|nr:hypothetical protein [Chitinophagales bacterium]
MVVVFSLANIQEMENITACFFGNFTVAAVVQNKMKMRLMSYRELGIVLQNASSYFQVLKTIQL